MNGICVYHRYVTIALHSKLARIDNSPGKATYLTTLEVNF